MNQKTLILIHPDHKKTLKNKRLVNQEIELILKTNNIKNYRFITYNKQFKKTQRKNYLKKIKFKFLKFLKINKDDLKNIKFLFTQYRNWKLFWGFYEVRYSKMLKRYIKYPAFIRYIFLFFYAKIKSELIQDWVKQFNCLITVCYYDKTILPFVQAFRNQNKKVWDVQHGSINPVHFAYKKNLFYLKSKLAPTGFYIYQKSAEQLLKNYLHDVVLIKCRNKKILNNEKVILVTLQWGNKLPKRICDFIKKVVKKKVILRMHPRDKDPLEKKFQDPSFLEFCKTSKNILIQTGHEPLSKTLKSTYLHLTENCSIVHEAAERGIISFFWCSKLAPKMFQNEMKLGLAKQLKNNTNLPKILRDYDL